MRGGCFVAVVGPSGAGKDTLIRHAERRLAGRDGFHFIRRLVTRGPNAFEDHDTIDAASFAAGHAAGAFALSWRAHGLGYAVPAEARERISAGAIAVGNISRGAIPLARQRFPRVAVVSVTAPPEILAIRLAGRGRETIEAVTERLRREAARIDELAADLVIRNDGAPEEAGDTLVAFLERLLETASA